MKACVTAHLVFLLFLAICGCSRAASGPGAGATAESTPVPSPIGTLAAKPTIAQYPTSTRELGPATIGKPSSTANSSAALPGAPTSAADLGTPHLIATPAAVGQLAAATLTAAAPENEPITPAADTLTPIVSPSPIWTVTPSLHYVFPIQSSENASYSAGHHDYPATDLFAPFRSSFVAVTDGTVDELNRIDRWDPATNDPAFRGGLYVSLIGDDGVRYYGSHLDEVAPGLRAGTHVTAGTLLGYVGSSGNARGIAPHVHFGISPPTFPGDWQVRRGTIWPYEYLQAWERGEDLKPKLP